MVVTKTILVFHCTDTHIYVFPVAIALSVVLNILIDTNPLKKVEVIVNEADGQLSVVYAIVANGVSQSDPKTSDVSTMEITGTFRPTLGQPFPILQIDEARLTIQIDKDAVDKK